MSPASGVGSRRSKTPGLILDATEQIMIEQGYAGVSSRRVAARAGIQAGHVHYYFPTLDDLLIAVFRRGAEKNLARMAAALASPQPLLSLWRLCRDPRGVAQIDQLMAAANHRQELRAEVIAIAQTARRMQLEAVRELLPQYGLDQAAYPAALVAAVIQGLAVIVTREEALGIDTEHDEAAAAFERLLAQLEDDRAARAARSRAS
jgi:AcrR family transcriptional regulator